MDVMELRRMVMAQMGKSNIRETTFILDEASTSISIPMSEKPYGVLIATDDETPDASNNLAVRFSFILNAGTTYRGATMVAVKPNGVNDFYNINSSNVNYVSGNFTVTVSGGIIPANRKYHVFWFTIPF